MTSVLSALLPVAVASLAWCLLLDRFLGEQHLLAVELSGLWVAALWAALTLHEVMRWRDWAEDLSIGAHETRLFGVPCRLTPRLGADALVLGPVRPRIYIGATLAASLTEEELRAVVYHEDHHRRTLAPIRAAALTAWLRLFGRFGAPRRLILYRLSLLEVMADADAIRRGVTPRSLARALLKGDPSVRPASFTYGAGERVEHLLRCAAGTPPRTMGGVPFEWLPTAFLILASVGCHAIV